MKRRWTAGLMLIAALAILLPPLGGRAVVTALRGYEKGQGYQYVYFGNYPYEKDGTIRPVLWRTLSVENHRALLMTEYVIDTTQIIFETDEKKIEAHAYRRISSWAESDAYPYLNTTVLDTLLGNDPLRSALIERPGFGKLFIPTSEDILNPAYGFSNNMWNDQPSHQAEGTPYAVKLRRLYQNGYGKSCYWAATIKSPEDYKLQLVGENGHLSWGAYTRVNVGLRLMVELDLDQLTIANGVGTWEKPYQFIYTGDSAPAAAPASSPAAPVEETEAPMPESPAPLPSPSAAPAAEAEQDSITISFVGDCSVGDSYQYKQSSTGYHAVIDEKGYAWPFSLICGYLKSDDLTVANLEVVFTNRSNHADKMYNLCADPDHVNILTAGGVDMVNTVNNHCWDFDRAGYQDSIDTLDRAGVKRFGSVYPTQDYGYDDLGVADVGGIRIGFVGFSYPQDSDQKRIAARIQKLKGEMGCDLVVVSLHWGRETYMTPESWQMDYAKEVIQAGADVIWGHHPHVIQPIQFYQGKPIFYSTGNFTFGTMSQVDPSTGIFQLTYHRDANGRAVLDQIQVIPCQTQGSPDYRPYELVDPAQRRDVFQKLTFKKDYKNYENPPASFLETGIIRFENGRMLP